MPSRPMIMVATGSGIAPLRDFTQHLVERADNGKDIGSTCVLDFFGCRVPAEELYKDGIDAARTGLDGKLTLWHVMPVMDVISQLCPMGKEMEVLL